MLAWEYDVNRLHVLDRWGNYDSNKCFNQELLDALRIKWVAAVQPLSTVASELFMAVCNLLHVGAFVWFCEFDPEYFLTFAQSSCILTLMCMYIAVPYIYVNDYILFNNFNHH